MRPARLYAPSISPGQATLSPDESNHAVAALRVRPGQRVVLFDGRGNEAEASVERCDRRAVTVIISRVDARPFDVLPRLTLAVAMPKAHRQGYLIEKATELGVAAIWPIITERGITRPGTASLEKWRRRAIEAAKQSRRAWVPEVIDPVSFAESLQKTAGRGARAMTTQDPAAEAFAQFVGRLRSSESLLVWVGPEGGWSDDETSRARRESLHRTTLSPTVLRTETAAVAVCAAVALRAIEMRSGPHIPDSGI